ncbi:prolipoprotein diacylglyceryl transferase [Cochleicola gelatinilyticus]|uniref:Phosphatidylglycerol--prolipoprotein diacylglyceryl transferase n=1 Tax=Cochleicola gelatinilyticus TaxID=1763537 RepID=A0A167ID42_9FLAO|nr:prolipoprotein diacylglyceryl transferase [Cochleicola gelatinilyticus]OAB79540.1 prolipoprotein diacylglyceryl transferase [Cochleicola gelatinilyticus]
MHHYLSFVWDPSSGIDLGFYVIRYYSLMFVIAFTLGWFIMKRIFENENESQEKLDSLFIYMVVATLIGARLGHVIFYQSELITQDPLSVFLPIRTVPEFEFTGFQGLASHGAAIVIIIAMFIYSKKVLKKPVLWILDRVVITVAAGAIFVRIGNFINSEIIGKATNSDFGVIFKQLGEDFPRHPAQLYESAGYVFVFLILWYFYWKTDKRKHLGFLFGMFLILLWTVRFFVEFVKEAQVGERADWVLNTGQLLSIPFIIIGIFMVLRSSKKQYTPS